MVDNIVLTIVSIIWLITGYTIGFWWGWLFYKNNYSRQIIVINICETKNKKQKKRI